MTIRELMLTHSELRDVSLPAVRRRLGNSKMRQVALSAEFEALIEKEAQLRLGVRAKSTMVAYRTDILDFDRWCHRHKRASFPATADTVRLYATWCAFRPEPQIKKLRWRGATFLPQDTQRCRKLLKAHHARKRGPLSYSTIRGRLAAISVFHKMMHHPSPMFDEDLKDLIRSIAKQLSVRQHGKDPITVDELRAICASLHVECPIDDPEVLATLTPDELASNEGHRNSFRLIDLRDKALLLLGFAGAFRRSELVSIDVEHLRYSPEGVVVSLLKSKTNQEGDDETVSVRRGDRDETCPVYWLRKWLEYTCIKSGPVFRPVDRHGNVKPKRLPPGQVATTLKERAARVGITDRDFGAHSMRAGFVTEADQRGRPERVIMRHTRHKSVLMVRRYIRRRGEWDDHAAMGLGL